MRKSPKRIQAKRIYDEPSEGDGVRVLVDRIWPRGVSKERAALDGWMKEIAPSDALRKRFHNGAGDWDEFVRLYRHELESSVDHVAALKAMAAGGTLTLLFASRNTERNNAVALKQFLESDA